MRARGRALCQAVVDRSSATTWARPASQTCTAPRPQPAFRPYRAPGGDNPHCMQLSLPVPAHAISTVATSHRTIPRSSDTGIQVRRAGSRSLPGTGNRKLWRNAPEPRRQPRLTSNIIQGNILFRPTPKVENKTFLAALNNFRYYLYESTLRINDIRLRWRWRWRLHIIGICNNSTPFADGERSRPQFQDLLYCRVRFSRGRARIRAIDAGLLRSSPRQTVSRASPATPCLQGLLPLSINTPAMPVDGRGRRVDESGHEPQRRGTQSPGAPGRQPAAAALKRATESTHCADRCANTASSLNATYRTISCADRPRRRTTDARASGARSVAHVHHSPRAGIHREKPPVTENHATS